MATEEGTIKRARQHALLRRHHAEGAIASHGGSKSRALAMLSPRPAAYSPSKFSFEEQASAERQLRQLQSLEPQQAPVTNLAASAPLSTRPRPSGALSARGRDVIHSAAKDQAESSVSTLSTKRTSVEIIISDSREMRNNAPNIERQSILPRGSVLQRGTRGSVLPRGSVVPRGSVMPNAGARLHGSVLVENVSPGGPTSLQNPGQTPGENGGVGNGYHPRSGSDQSEDQARKGGASSSKVRMSFGAFRQAKVLKDVPLVQQSIKEEEPIEARVLRLKKRFAFSSEEEVRRIMGYYKTALQRHNDSLDGEQAELLPLQALRIWLCDFSGLEENQSLGHLLDPEWPKEKCLSEDEFFEWYNNHQWNEEIMVPDPLERRVRHFCRNQGYHISDVERVKSAFERADRDSSGLLDQLEFAACYAGLVGIDPSEVVESRFRILWEEVDEDKNGVIDLLEFAKWYLRVNPPAGRGPVKPF